GVNLQAARRHREESGGSVWFAQSERRRFAQYVPDQSHGQDRESMDWRQSERSQQGSAGDFGLDGEITAQPSKPLRKSGPRDLLRGLFLLRRIKAQRGRVDAIALAGGFRAVRKYVA